MFEKALRSAHPTYGEQSEYDFPPELDDAVNTLYGEDEDDLANDEQGINYQLFVHQFNVFI